MAGHLQNFTAEIKIKCSQDISWKGEKDQYISFKSMTSFKNLKFNLDYLSQLAQSNTLLLNLFYLPLLSHSFIRPHKVF